MRVRIQKFFLSASVLAVIAPAVVSQQIWDIYTTKWDRTNLFRSLKPASPINFSTPGPIGQAHLNIDDATVYQQMVGFGGSLTDSAALTLNNLKSSNGGAYWDLLYRMFDANDNAEGAGLSFIRLPIGASDFSGSEYSWNDNAGDTSASRLTITAPGFVMSVLNDIKTVNPNMKLFLVPWSPPGWMKTGGGGGMKGGTIQSQYVGNYHNYLHRAVAAIRNAGFNVYAVSVQNEPEHADNSYPTCTMSASQYATIGNNLKNTLNSNGLGSVKVLAYEHNWDHAAEYPVQVLRQAPNLDGAAFHCYAGNVANQDAFHNAFPNKEVHFTECTGTIGSDWWSDVKWYMDTLFIGSVQHWSSSAGMWNIAVDPNGNPKFPGTSSCGNGCRGIVQISGGGYQLNQEFWAMAQAQKAINPKDPGGPFGQRIKLDVSGGQGWALRANAFVTRRTSASEWQRYSIVVLNWNDGSSSGWNPQPVTTTIRFRGQQATVTFDVGVTTLWWYAPPR